MSRSRLHTRPSFSSGSSTAGKYVAHWTDTFGGKFSAMGTGTRTGNSVEFRFEYPEGPFFNTFSWAAEQAQWTFRGESRGRVRPAEAVRR